MWNTEKQNKKSYKTKPITNPRNLTVELRLAVRRKMGEEQSGEETHWTTVEDFPCLCGRCDPIAMNHIQSSPWVALNI